MQHYSRSPYVTGLAVRPIRYHFRGHIMRAAHTSCNGAEHIRPFINNYKHRKAFIAATQSVGRFLAILSPIFCGYELLPHSLCRSASLFGGWSSEISPGSTIDPITNQPTDRPTERQSHVFVVQNRKLKRRTRNKFAFPPQTPWVSHAQWQFCFPIEDISAWIMSRLN